MVPKILWILVVCCLALCGCGGAAPAVEMADNAQTQAPAAAPAEAECAIDFSVTGTVDGTAVFRGVGEETTAAVQTDVQYFLLDRLENSIVSETGTELVYEKQGTAAYYSCDHQAEKLVNQMLQEISDRYTSDSQNLSKNARAYVEENGTGRFYSFSNYQQLEIARHDERVISVLVKNSVYSGGDQPVAMQTSYNLDMKQMRALQLEDVIYEEAEGKLLDMVMDNIVLQLDEYGIHQSVLQSYKPMLESLLDYGNMTACWYLNDHGLVLFYNQYELVQYATGVIRAELSYDQLEGVLREEFLPELDGTAGDLIPLKDWEGEPILIALAPEGERVILGVEGKLRQVQLSQISWVDGTLVGRKMLFSADAMSAGDMLEIVAEFNMQGQGLAIEFMDGTGAHTLYFLHENGLVDWPGWS